LYLQIGVLNDNHSYDKDALTKKEVSAGHMQPTLTNSYNPFWVGDISMAQLALQVLDTLAEYISDDTVIKTALSSVSEEYVAVGVLYN
jgi:hypothetical protein